jgi:hypothetical protein
MNFKSIPTATIILFAVTLATAACSKSSTKKTKADQISSATWKFSQAGVDFDNNGTIDVAAPVTLLQPCITDNIITFKSDKTGIVDEGATKCATTDPQTSNFTWSLSSDETIITFSAAIIAGVGGDAKIIDLTDTNFRLSKTIDVAGYPAPVPVIVVLVH